MVTPSSIKTLSLEVGKKVKIPDFDAIRVVLASPEDILSWSFGEITRPETINYRTQRPERDGLFCQKIFGPVKDWQCACGKYKKIRYKGIVCDKCGVEVTRSIVRRERMGHISLCAPVAHIWFLRNIPSKIGLILNLTSSAVEKIVYFASFIITEVNEELKEEMKQRIEAELKTKDKMIKKEFENTKNQLLQNPEAGEKKIEELEKDFMLKKNNLKSSHRNTVADLKRIEKMTVLTEIEYQKLSLKYGHIFEVGIGAEAIKDLLTQVDLSQIAKDLRKELDKVDNFDDKKLVKRLKLAEALIRNKIKPEWMVMTVVPVIPPDLRPMVQLDGGRFASSDLNDLYRRVINRNNRLKRLLELHAPEVIQRNEKRMLQEAVDALIDNGVRHSKTMTNSSGGKRALKSIADILRGKQGRFRQNLLGKRVDYSGRSVIVVGPHLKLHQCGLPKKMAIELFKPFVISRLIRDDYVYNVRAASRMIEDGEKVVWDILEDVIKEYKVLLNRAPTLHRLGIQAFEPVLIEGKAIQLHPFVCPAFNADFDGDQMAVHLPISQKAQQEASELMLSSRNLLKPSTGNPIAIPTQDMVWGCYYMTLLDESIEDVKKIKNFSGPQSAQTAYQQGKIALHEVIGVRINDVRIQTCVGRVIFNSLLPEEYRDYNLLINQGLLKKIIRKMINGLGMDVTAPILDEIKERSLKIITETGFSWGMDDLPTLKGKAELVEAAENEIEKIESQFKKGLLSDEERYYKIIKLWIKVKEDVTELGKAQLDHRASPYTMMDAQARGSWGQLIQMVGMKGLVSNPLGRVIELPVKRCFKEGFDVLEYFISTHGARKGLTDTALRTAGAGYLTRRLVDVAHEVIVTEDDCGEDNGLIITKEESEQMNETLAKRVEGRVVLEKIKDPKTNEVIVNKNELITPEMAEKIAALDLTAVKVRSVLTCKAKNGVCRKCYGLDLGRNKLVELGSAVGVVAAQSIGEPGTQLTLRTFHTGGVLGSDITQGLPRVEELLEARSVKYEAVISEMAGKIKISEDNGHKVITVSYDKTRRTKYEVSKDDKVVVKDGEQVKKNDTLIKTATENIKAKSGGMVKIDGKSVTIVFKTEEEKEYKVPFGYTLVVKDGDLVGAGDRLTEGSLDLKKLYKFKGREVTQRYIIREIQSIYSAEGQGLNDKHIETIVRQMFSRVQITESGDSILLVGEIVEKSYFERLVREINAKGGKLPKAVDQLLGITRVSLSTGSFLSAASFQETSRILIGAALNGRVDNLVGLKENVIIGRLIPVGTGFKKE
jgi:DNA-directed RNA polymerase subunit beta'